MPKQLGRAKNGAHRGVSLVEVLVVMVVIIIGMLAIARLFPEGIASLDYTGNVTLADALSRENAEGLTRRRENLPDGIIGVDYASGLIRLFDPAQLNHTEPYRDNPIAVPPGTDIPADPRFSGPNKVRRIVGEQFKLQPPALHSFDIGNELVSTYNALFTPIYSISPMAEGPPSRSPGAMIRAAALGVDAYSGTPSQRVLFSDPPTRENVEALLRLGPQGYGINYDRALVFVVSQRYSRTFKVEYTFRANAGTAAQMAPNSGVTFPADPAAVANPDSAGNILNPVRMQIFDMHGAGTVADAQFDIDTGFTSVAAAAPQPTPFLGIGPNDQVEPGSDLIYRRLKAIGSSTAFSEDPYEFKVYDTVFGLFGFHPALATMPLPSQQGRGLTIRLDYDVDDWHILREDVTVPSQVADTTSATPFYAMRLSTGAIKRVGETEDFLNFVESGTADNNTFEYQGLIRYYPAHGPVAGRPGSPGVDVVIVDVETGLRITSRTMQKPGTTPLPGVNNNDGEIDYEHGVLHLRDNVTFLNPFSGAAAGTANPAGRKLRVYYRAVKDFAVATFKPYNNYFRTIDATDFYPPAGTLPDVDRKIFQFAPDTINYAYGAVNPGSSYLMISNSDGEKSVAVDYQWQEIDFSSGSAQPGAFHTEAQELHQVNPPTDPRGPLLPSQYAAFPWWWIRVGHADVDAGKGPADSGAGTGIDSTGNTVPNVVPGSVRIIGVRGASLQTHVVWRQNRRWRHHRRTTVLTREHSR